MSRRARCAREVVRRLCAYDLCVRAVCARVTRIGRPGVNGCLGTALKTGHRSKRNLRSGERDRKKMRHRGISFERQTARPTLERWAQKSKHRSSAARVKPPRRRAEECASAVTCRSAAVLRRTVAQVELKMSGPRTKTFGRQKSAYNTQQKA
ncbi:hypothetical protein FA95DRAFT_805968 [Auriscalpium vulgare]|uniref:Uncharacterized protein n=1 Tax=Auriscalpium vulgare TaxID=40419 RepID=A0ACB8RBI3_9AGAM|nr:hypothetical protein FA95DRAFT_805968 [Auriscalpium vulgare]